jgi:fructose-bisphosphate aldolase class I
VLFSILKAQNIFIPGLILKTSMVVGGLGVKTQSSAEEVARMTLKCLNEHVPRDIGGIVFLSGGESDEDATMNLNAMHKNGPLSWPLTFSYSRALQRLALASWAKDPDDVAGAQKLLLEAAEKNSRASVGEYK